MMKKLPFAAARFLTSAAQASQFPSLPGVSEIAFIGKSNVGKSSLINSLTRHKGLAKTSSTPGKTQLINFFLIDEQLALVDLPGYGYAKTSHKIRQSFAPLIQAYLENRPSLKLLLLLVDIRRGLGDEDRGMIAWANTYQRPVLVILTKTDKLTQNELTLHKEEFSAPCPTLYYSIKDRNARIALIETLNHQLSAHGTC